MPSLARSQWMVAGTVTILASGLLFLLIYCVAESAANPGFSIVDAYWRGRLPWMGIALAWIISAATATALTGGWVALVAGGWFRRIAVVPPLLAAAAWWLLAMMPPRRAVPCDSCPPPAPDPFAYAYSLPEYAALMLIVPALVIAAIASTAGQRQTSA